MIEANELRIGNWYNQFDNFHQASWVTIKDLSEAPKSQIWCKPIPLTPEILENCGFEKRFIKNDICYCLPYIRPSGKKPIHDIVLVNFGTFDNNLKNVYAFAIKEYDRDIQFAVTYIKYIHQLQNLYFALTGEELTINL